MSAVGLVAPPNGHVIVAEITAGVVTTVLVPVAGTVTGVPGVTGALLTVNVAVAANWPARATSAGATGSAGASGC